MSDRERWIVYPLLFLALGAALRDKLAKQTRAKQIVCEQLYLVDPEGRPAAVLTGEELRFDVAGVGNGLVRANVVDAQGLFERGKPVVTRQPQSGVRLPLQELLKLLPQMGITPPAAPPGEPQPAPEAEPPADAAPPGPVAEPPDDA